MSHAGNGGLQRHSIGETYPWMVVGTINMGGTAYYIANLTTNERDIYEYESSYVAHELASRIGTGAYVPDLVRWINA